MPSAPTPTQRLPSTQYLIESKKKKKINAPQSPSFWIYRKLMTLYPTKNCYTNYNIHFISTPTPATRGTLALFTSFFHNRTQSVHTQHATANPQTITHGIPQGSTLSTTLFLMYINDLWTTSQHSTIYTYADDTSLIISAPDLPTLKMYAQHDLTSLVNYLHANNLCPNSTKTTYTTFYPNSYPDIALSFNNVILQKTLN